jgi:hypothetical protein
LANNLKIKNWQEKNTRDSVLRGIENMRAGEKVVCTGYCKHKRDAVSMYRQLV